MGYTTTEVLQFVKDVKEMGENLDIAIDENVLEIYENGQWSDMSTLPNIFNHDLAIISLWKNLDAFISKQIAGIQQAQAKAASAPIHVGADGKCSHHGKDSPYLKVRMAGQPGLEQNEILCIKCIADFLSHHASSCAPNNGRITFEEETEDVERPVEHQPLD